MPTGVVNVCVANVYEADTYKSQTVTQAILGERLNILDSGERFSLVELPDAYTGWISNFQFVTGNGTQTGRVIKVREHWTRIFQEPHIDSLPVRDAVIGTRLYMTGEAGEWLRVGLPDGTPGWIRKSATGEFPERNREGILKLAREFLGYPYLWGGRSPKGFDCSGLTQTVLGLLGISLPRDSWMQQNAGKPVDVAPEDTLPGDLYFFSEKGDRITHVGIAAGRGRILHARGYVRINSLIDGDQDYSGELRSTLVDVRSFF